MWRLMIGIGDGYGRIAQRAEQRHRRLDAKQRRARVQHEHHGAKANDHRTPAMQADPLAQDQRGQQGDEQRRGHVHHRRLCQRHAAERDVIGGKRKEREHPAGQHQPRLPRAQNPRALPGQRHREQQREHDREPNHQDLDHRIALGQQLDDRILRRKRQQREHAEQDAGYGAMGRVDREVRQGLKQGSLRAVGEFTIVVYGRLQSSG